MNTSPLVSTSDMEGRVIPLCVKCEDKPLPRITDQFLASGYNEKMQRKEVWLKKDAPMHLPFPSLSEKRANKEIFSTSHKKISDLG